MKEIGEFIARLFEEHKLARRATLLWAVVLITWAIDKFLNHVTEITAPVATVMVAVIGILATVIAFYQWSRDKDGRDG